VTTVDLLDVNVWIALALPDHVYHHRAQSYWSDESLENIAFCSLTLTGFLRVSTHYPTPFGPPFTASESWEAFHLFIDLPEVIFLDQPNYFLRDLARFTNRQEFPKTMWPDACLAAWAVGHEARLVSFDADFHQFPGLNFLHLT